MQKYFLAALSVAMASVLCAQSGRFEQQKRVAFTYLKDGKYDNAAAKLEEIWDFDKSDPMVAEGLSIAYLNGVGRKANAEYETRAYQLIEKSLKNGGKAVFIVLHSHERLSVLQGRDVINFCAGRLQIQSGKVSYVGETGDKAGQHSFDLTRDGIRAFAANSGRGGLMFHVATADHKTFNFIPRSKVDADATFILNLASRYVMAVGK